MIRYAITDGVLQPGACVGWGAGGVDFVQLRDKDAEAGELARRACAMLLALRHSGIKLLVNGRADVALAVGAAGVHLTGSAEELTVAQVRQLMPEAVVSVSCHTQADVARARDAGADWMLFGPVFEKRVGGEIVAGGVGLEALRVACAVAGGKVLALGGVTALNAEACVRAGAAGVAAIRMFANGGVAAREGNGPIGPFHPE